jgi:hypothetical protein
MVLGMREAREAHTADDVPAYADITDASADYRLPRRLHLLRHVAPPVSWADLDGVAGCIVDDMVQALDTLASVLQAPSLRATLPSS